MFQLGTFLWLFFSCTTEAFYVPDGRIAGLVGVYASGAIWMLCTKAVEDHPILFVKEAKAYIESRKEQRLFNICDKRNTLHLKLLKLLGFNFTGEVLHGPNNLPFIEFEKCAHPPSEMVAGIASSVGQFASGQAQAAAQNKAAIQNYEYQIAQRENKWRQTLSAWGHKRLEYKQAVQENEAAAWAGYTQEQTRLNEVYKDVKFKNQDALIQLIDAQGKMAASGQSGNTARRMQVAAMAAYGRNQAINAESLISARNRMINSNDNIRRQQMSANNRAYSQVALRPIAGFAPPPPVMTPGPSPLSLIGGIGSAVAGGIGEMNALQGTARICWWWTSCKHVDGSC